MKVTVWTRYCSYVDSRKCVFQGEYPFEINVGDNIVVREGFAAEKVISIIHDLPAQAMEVIIDNNDVGDDYGVCVYNPNQ